MRVVVDSDSEVEHDVSVTSRQQILADMSHEESTSFMASDVEDVDTMLNQLALSVSDRRASELEQDRAAVAKSRTMLHSAAAELAESIEASLSQRSALRRARLQELALVRERQRLARERKRQQELERQQQLEQQRLELERQRAADAAAVEAAAAKRAEKEAAERAEAARAAEAKKAKEAADKAAKEAADKAAKDAAEKAQQEKEKANEAAKEAAAKEAVKEAAAKEAAAETSDGFSDPAAIQKEYAHWINIIKRIKTDVNAPVAADKQLKNQCFLLKTKIKPRLGQLTNSKRKLVETRDALRDVFVQAKQAGDIVFKWTLNIYAKGVVHQAESEAHLAVQTAIPLAMVSVLLWGEFPELGDFLVARFVKKCPQVIGYACPIDTEEGRLRMGFKREGQRWESMESYSERIAGMCAVWSAMTQTKLGAQQNIKHPYPIVHSWVFLARQLNKPKDLLLNADFAAVAAWWDITASRFQVAFGRQANKILELATDGWTQSVADNRWPAAARLRLLGEDWKTEGTIKPAWKPLVA